MKEDSVQYNQEVFKVNYSSDHMLTTNYIGGEKWEFSDQVLHKLTGQTVKSNFHPKLSIKVSEIPNLLPNKKVFGLFWSTPTFKDTDCNYLFHIHDDDHPDYVVSPSSGNTVEGMARAIRTYNEEMDRNIRAILLVPDLSAYKVSRSVIENNPYIKYIVLKNSTLDKVRAFAKEVIEQLSSNYKVLHATPHIKTAAYAQIGLALKENGLLSDDTCYAQTVSGGVGPAGVIESAYKLNLNPEILIVQPLNGRSSPIIDALNAHSRGKNPLSVFDNVKYSTSHVEPTLGSAKPVYAINKFIQWREKGGRILPVKIVEENLNYYRDKILKCLVEAGIYPNKEIGLELFNIEKSGFMAFVGALIYADNIKAKKIIINFTGRHPDPKVVIPEVASPNINYNPVDGTKELMRRLNL
ncbi:MAG: hypothetical protein ACW990_10230 [Promethearchaeota archaeon]|jgi:hypothetical protein